MFCLTVYEVQNSTISFWLIGFTKVPITQYTPNMSLKTGIGHHPITIGNQKMFGLSVYRMVQSGTISFWLKNSFLKENGQIGFTKVPITQYTPNMSL